MKITSKSKGRPQYFADVDSFKPSDIFDFPFESVRICVDNGQFEGPWIQLAGDEGELMIEFESECSSTNRNFKDKEAKLFLRTVRNIIIKNQVPIEFSVHELCKEVWGKESSEAA